MNGTTLDRYLLRDAATSWFAVTLVLLIVSLALHFLLSGLGLLFFGERPDRTALAGAAVIVGAGLFLWWRGRVHDRSGPGDEAQT